MRPTENSRATLPQLQAAMETSHPKCSLAKLRLMEPKIAPSIAGQDGRADGAADVVGGRKSLSRIETGDAVEAAAALLGVKVLAADMPPFMRAHAFRCARRAYGGLDRFSSKQVAHDVKKEFDKVYGPTWHCIVGMSYGSFVTHSRGCFIYFSMEKITVMLFKTGIRVKD